ncbi:glutathione synthetase-like [Prorops nasuta]|uniref:glutathione synthetase-like n=1 Tax=Prorops nasuta TaxID=863751 RepID=UPI0034CF814F
MGKKSLEPCIKLSLKRDNLQDVVDKAIDWTLMHGISMRSPESYKKGRVEIVPFTLLPSSFPKKEFEKGKNIQKLLNELMHKVAYDHEFLKNSLQSVIEADDFTAQLYKIYETVSMEGFSQDISLGLFRSDYLLHFGTTIKQVEFNTIASSFAGLAPIISQYHRYILEELGHKQEVNNIPNNNTTVGFSTGLVHAWELYNNKEAAILFVVENGVTYNISDQRFHEFEIRRLSPEIKVIRKSLVSLKSCLNLGPNKELLLDDDVIAVVYFRAGYGPETYSTDCEWSTRLLIERSCAIKCPSIQYHLAGSKKVQQALAVPGALNRFFDDPICIKQIQDVFTGLYSLDLNSDGEANIERAIKEHNNYVLKPQREGGGNNLYNKDIKNKLLEIRKSKERTAWILMDRISPGTQNNYLITPNITSQTLKSSEVVSELGIYGVIIGNKNKIMHNEEVGHVLRSKLASTNEGGIVAGFGVLDSPYLIA